MVDWSDWSGKSGFKSTRPWAFFSALFEEPRGCSKTPATSTVFWFKFSRFLAVPSRDYSSYLDYPANFGEVGLFG